MIAEKLYKQELFTSLDKATSEFIELVSLFTEQKINTVPFEGSWTAAQVAEHVTKSNSLITKSLNDEGKTIDRGPDEGVQTLREVFLDFTTKLQSPELILPAQNKHQRETLIAELRESIEQLKRAGKAANLFHAVKHPIFGEITKLELLHFVVYHTQRHIYQLKKIYKAIESKPLVEMRRVILFMHVSLDGFVAGNNGEMNWITMDEEIFEDAIDLASTTDTALYGRVTYQMMENYWPTVLINPTSSANELRHAQWVEDIHKIVFSRTLEKVEWNNTRLIKENIAQEISKLKQQPGKSMMIFGSPTLAHSFMQLGLIDVYRINVNPVILGHGIPLFKNIQDRINLKLLTIKRFKSGVVGLHYETKVDH
ncbi:MAG TPA: dihydrofolate reductase family protein [Chitinophagaceae bacterium]|jgi:dihydrofolate reductase|nr:dihydrofolate reductase family protein [Chitinophagaceae bacterium]